MINIENSLQDFSIECDTRNGEELTEKVSPLILCDELNTEIFADLARL